MDPLYFAPQRKFPYGWVCFKDSPSPPPAPNYTGAANATAASQRVSQYTPYGSQVYSQTGVDSQDNPTFRSDINLTPEAQRSLDSQMQLSSGMGDIANSYLPQVQQQYSQPMDLQSVQDVQDKAYGAMTSRLDPQWAQREGMQKNELANQGLAPGGEAYDNAMRNFSNARNDAYQQANLGAIQTAPQTYQLASSMYNQPLNTLNALRTGAQVQNPQFQTQPGANYLGAATSQGQYNQGLYSSDVASTNSANSAGIGAGATVAAAFFI